MPGPSAAAAAAVAKEGSGPSSGSSCGSSKPKSAIGKAERRKPAATWVSQDLSLISGLIAVHLMHNVAHCNSGSSSDGAERAVPAAAAPAAETAAKAKAAVVVDHLALSIAEGAFSSMST